MSQIMKFLSKQMQQSKSNEWYELLDIFSLKYSFFTWDCLYGYYSKGQE